MYCIEKTQTGDSDAKYKVRQINCANTEAGGKVLSQVAV